MGRWWMMAARRGICCLLGAAERGSFGVLGGFFRMYNIETYALRTNRRADFGAAPEDLDTTVDRHHRPGGGVPRWLRTDLRQSALRLGGRAGDDHWLVWILAARL